MHQNLPQHFRRNHIADSIMFFDLFSPRPCRRRTMGYFGKQSPKHYFGFPHAGQNSMESGYDYVWQFRMPYIVCEKYLMWLFYSSNNLGWFACFRIQFLPDHIMIHSCLVCLWKWMNMRYTGGWCYQDPPVGCWGGLWLGVSDIRPPPKGLNSVTIVAMRLPRCGFVPKCVNLLSLLLLYHCCYF